MRYLLLASALLSLCACSNFAENMRDMTSLLRNTSIPNTTTAGVGTAGATGAVVHTGAVAPGVAVAEVQDGDLKIISPAIAENGAVVPITVAGLNLQPGETADLFADNCQVMSMTNRGNRTIRSLSTRVKMSKSGSGNVRVNVNGRQAISKPIRITVGSGECNQNLALNTTDTQNIETDKGLKGLSKTIRMRGKYGQGVVSIKALITHPMETGLRVSKKTGQSIPAHYITNLTMAMNNQEVASIQSTAGLSKNPYIAMQIDTDVKDNNVSLVWRDNSGYSDKTSETIH